MKKSHKNITAGRQMSDLVNGRIVPAIEELRARWDRMYPAVKTAGVIRALVCRPCGRRIDACEINDQACQRRMVSGRRLGHPDGDSPDEYATVCPDCGAVENFREIVDED